MLDLHNRHYRNAKSRPIFSMRMKQLDALRAIAILLVMIEHFGGRTLNAHIPIGAGSVGVGLFFTLSGFLITGILMQSFENAGGGRGAVWMDFYVRRLLRLMPPYYAVIAALVLLGIPPVVQSWPWDMAYLTNFYIARFGNESVFWTLAVEEQFYLLWPFVIAFAPRRWLIPAILSMCGLSLLFKLGILLAGLDTRAVTRLLFANFVLLGAGCLLAVISYRNGRANCFEWYEGAARRRFVGLALLGLSLALLSWAIFPKEGGLVRYFTNDILVGVFYAWLVLQAAIGIKGRIGRLFDNPGLQYVGRISYGLYLVHNWMPEIVARYAGPLPKYQAGAIVLVSTFAICILSWHFFERPILGLKRFFRLPAKAKAREEEEAKPPEQRPAYDRAY
jgi:peptidoglycan/LPS O-acetylase OafA/YrhL